MFKFVNNWIEKAVAKEVANQNKSKRWEDIYDKLNLNEVDRQKLLARSFQRTSEDMKPVNAKGHAMDAACVGGSLKNVFGVSNYADDVIFTHFAQQGFIGYQACALLAQNWIINNACSVPCEDAIRPGYEISLNQDIELEDQDLLVKIKQVSERKYNISNIARNFARNNKIFGCALALPVVDGIDYAKPFNIDGVRRGSYKGISLIEPYWVMPELDMEATSAPESLHFYEPTWWRLPNGKRIHRSHVIYITGDEVPDVLKPTYYFGGLPLTQQIYERVYASERVANEAPLMALTKRMLIADGNIEAYLMNEEDAEKKLQKLSYCRDNYGVFFKRPGDNVQQIDTSLTDFDALIMTQYQLVASIARMPATKLLKTQPKGFNATGEYEMKDYIQELQHLQDNQMKPLIERNNLLVEKSEFGYSYELEAKFNPVDMPTERELAEVRKIDADTDMVLINAGAISPEEARARIIADPNSGYNGLPAEMPHSDFIEENFLDDETAAGEQLFGKQPEQTLDEWNEEDHPRDDDGKFGKGGVKAKEGKVVLTGTELGGKDLEPSVLRNKAKEYYKNNLAGTKVKNPELGEIEFSSGGFRKPVSLSADIRKLQLFPALKEIIAKGKLIESEDDRYKRANVDKFYTLLSRVTLNGENIKVRVSIRKDSTGKLYYDHVVAKESSDHAEDDECLELNLFIDE